MMKKFSYAIIYLAFILSAGSASAGVKGYKVVFIDLTANEQFKSIFVQYRNTITPSSTSNCWNARKGNWIDIAYAKKQPIEISKESLQLATAGDEKSVKKFAYLLGQYRDDEITSGFDGALIVTSIKTDYFVVGISRDSSLVKSRPFRSKSTKALDFGLCVAASSFDKAFIP